MQFKTLIDLKVFRATLLIFASIPLLQGGCVVDSEPDPNANTVIKSSSTTLRLIQPDDFYEYEFSGFYSLDSGGLSESTSGTLTIDYTSDTSLVHPFPPNATISPILKETSVLTFKDGPVITTVRYITQDTDTASSAFGTIYTRAYPAPGTGYYWVNGSSSTDRNVVKSTVDKTPTLRSPIMVGDTYTNIVNILEGCANTGVCNDWLRRVTEITTVAADKVEARTPLGNFEAIQMTFNSGLSSDESLLVEANAWFDVRTACETYNKNLSNGKVRATYSGNYKVFPDVGIVRFEINCSQIGYTILGFLSDTNVDIPEAAPQTP